MSQAQPAAAPAQVKWKITGQQLAACNCKTSPCPCVAAGGNPTEGDCKLLYVFSIGRGSYGDVDLSGLHVGLAGRFPSFVLDGNWELGLVIDERADDRQVDALHTVLTGQAGGTFGDLAPLIGKFLGVERAGIRFDLAHDGEHGSITAGKSKFEYKPLKGPGGRTELVHGAVAFRDRVFPGKSLGGTIEHFGIKTDTYYGEACDIEFSN